jgi:membrane protein DedA with SNARE-associated domain
VLLSYISEFTGFVRAYPHLAYGLVLLLALSESLPVLGAVVPGTAIIVGLATLVPSGVLKLYPLLIAALVGAMLGDGLSFWLGHRYHREILVRWPFRRYPQLIERSEAFFERHGGKSVFLARFTPGVRAFVPLVAGMLQMPVGGFYMANILSALIWAPLHILPGVLLGAYVHSASDATGRLAILVLVLAGLIWLTIGGVRLGFQRGLPILQSRLDHLRLWVGTRDNWVSNKIAVLINPAKRETAVLAGLAVILMASAWLFFAILEDVVTGDPLVGFDKAVFQLLQSLRTSWGDSMMIGLTEVGDTSVVVPVTIAVSAWLLWKRAWRTSAYFLAAVAGASIFNTAIKVAVHRARPVDDLYTGWSNFSFPSGHSTENAVLYGFLAFLVCRNIPPARRIAVTFAAAVLIILIAFSRVYLGAHWFSDVVGGLAFAVTWLTLLSIAYLHHRSSDDRTGGVLIVAVAAVVIAGGFNVVRHHHVDMQRYAVKYDIPMIEVADWWKSGWQDLPVERVDFTGETEEPFTLQWAGSLDRLKTTLENGSWQEPPTWTMESSLRWFAPSKPMLLPVLSHLERGAMPSLTLVRANETSESSSRYVLRVWRADRRLDDNLHTELWLGSVVEEELPRHLSIVTYPVAKNSYDDPRNVLSQALAEFRLVSRSGTLPNATWDGDVLISHDASLPIE